MAVVRNIRFGIAAVVNEDLLCDAKEAGGLFESFHVERAVLIAEFHEVQRCQVARRIVDEHELAARIRRVDRPGSRTGMPFVDRRVKLHPRIAAYPRTFGNKIHQLPRRMLLGRLTGGYRMRGPLAVFFHRLHEFIGRPDRQVAVLEHYTAIGLVVEVSAVAMVDESPGLLFFFGLAGDEIFDIRVVHLQRLHLGGATRLAAGFDHGGYLIENTHETQGAGWLSAAGELFATAAKRRKVRARAGAVLEEHRLAPGKPHDVVHRVGDGLDKARRSLRVFIAVFTRNSPLLCLVPAIVVAAALDAVDVIEPHVEPDG